MGNYNPRVSITSAPGLTGYLYLVLAEASAPNVPVANSGQLAPPHSTSRQIQFLNLNGVVHIGTLYETNGVSTTGTVRANFSLDPQYAGVEIRPDLFIYGGETDGFDVGDNKYVDPDDYLDDWDYSLEVRHAGTLDPDVEYTKDSLNNPTITSGTELAGGGTYQIFENEIWVFHFFAKIVNFTNDSSVANQAFIVTELITANRTLVVGDLKKNFIIQSATSTITITLPALSAISDNRQMFFMSDGGSHKNVTFICQGSDQISYRGLRDDIILGQGEAAIFYKAFNKWYVSNDLPGVLNVGKFTQSYEQDISNTILASGQLISRTVYARLWQWVNEVLSPDYLISEAQWDGFSGLLKGFYSTGDGSTTFRVPLIVDFLRSVDGIGRIAGSFQDSANLAHVHSVQPPNSNSQAGAGKTTTGNDSTEGTITAYNTASQGESEARPKNIGYYLSINI